LATFLGADLLLMDDRKGVSAAIGKGLRVTGTLGVLDLASHRGLIDFAKAINHLRQTTFRIPEALLDSLLRKHESGNA
jgi:predicted nucleic acid-binding protein